MKRHLRVGAFVLLLGLLQLLCLPAAAILPQYTPSNAYRKSTYHQSLADLPKTGDGAFDTVSVALSQLGYHEGNGTADLGGKNQGGSRNFTEYNFALGKIDGSYGYAWCAAFASWCLQQSGERESAGGLFASCTLWVDKLRELGQYSTRGSGYTPRSGDLIFFRSSGVTRASDHVGLVRYVSGGRVYTVEGNSSGKVSLREYKLTDSYIVGYGKPQYKGGSLGIKRTAHEDKSDGWYVVTYDFLNLRAERSAASPKKGELDHGDMVRITAVENGWGAMEYNGITVYVSLDYADFVAPVPYQVTYESEGTTLLESDFYSTSQPFVAAFTPTREGYLFLHWQTEQGERYHALDALPVADIRLQAVWEQIPVPQPPVQPPEGTEQVLPPQLDLPGAVIPPAAEGGPPSPTPQVKAAAARHAGVVSAVLSLCASFIYLYYRRREE